MTRVALQLGAAWLRLAAEGRLVAELPAAGVDPSTVLTGLFDAPVDELVVVHPAGARPACSAAARTVRAVPAAVAALAQHAVPAGVLVAHAVVVDVGHRGAEVAYVRAGRVVAVRRSAVGGARLDAAAAGLVARAGSTATPAEARRLREALSLHPQVRAGTPPAVVRADDLCAVLSGPLAALVEVVGDTVRDVGPGRAPPVLVIGGVARTPLLAELLDAAGIRGVRVADRPDAAAVTGALHLPGTPVPGGPGPGAARRPVPGSPSRPVPPDRPPPDPRAGVPTPGTAAAWLPPLVPARHRRLRAAVGALAAAGTATGLLAAGAALPPVAPSPAPVAGELVQYGYAVHLPAGWAHTGGLPERRRSLLTPVAAPDGTDLISVERTPLGYDAGAEPGRARAELRAEFAAAVAAGASLAGFDDDARYAGRSVVSYREVGGGTAGEVDWYVVLDGDAQLSVGCRHTPAGTPTVDAACATVVGSLRRAG